VSSIFDATTYKDYIKSDIAAQPKVRGYHSRLAAAAGCRSSYLSQVLGGNAHLTLDQASGLCDFWAFSDAEADYFLGMLDLERAATPALRTRLTRRLRAAKERQTNLAERYTGAETIAQSTSVMTYYSAWHLAAVHILIGIPAFQSADAVAARLRLPTPLVLQALVSLREMGLAIAEGSVWKRSPIDLHLPKDSPMAGVFHGQWRRRAEAQYPVHREDELFYTAIHSLAVKDVPRLRSILVKALDETRSVVAPSPEEEVVCLACDLFRV
jgi:hypothetical protein